MTADNDQNTNEAMEEDTKVADDENKENDAGEKIETETKPEEAEETKEDEKPKIVFEEQQITVQGIDINYVRHGTGDINVIMITDYFGTWEDFRTTLETLNPEKFTMIAFDPPGYGKSVPPNRLPDGKRYTNEVCKKDASIVIDMMRKLKLEPFNVLGWGEGLRTAIYTMHKGGVDLVPKGAIWCGSPYVSDRIYHWFQMMLHITRDGDKTKTPWLEKYEKRYIDTTWRAIVNFHQETYRNVKPTRRLPRGNICCEEMFQLKQPVFVMHALKDTHLSFNREARYMNEKIPDAVHMREHPDSDHRMHMEKVEWFTNYVEKYLTGHEDLMIPKETMKHPWE